MRIQEGDLKGSVEKTKQNIKKKVTDKFKEKITESGKTKSKVNHLRTRCKEWKACERQTYMDKLTRYQVSMIFKARTRMLKVKNNFRGMFQDNECRICNNHEETQEHIFTCIEKTTGFQINNREIFSNNLVILKNTARKLRICMEELEKNKTT